MKHKLSLFILVLLAALHVNAQAPITPPSSPPKTKRSVTLRSNPSEAYVFVDGAYKGYTPVTLSLTLGTHKIKIDKSGSVWEGTINVTQSGQSEWIFDVRNERQISLKSNPSGASIYVDSDYLGTTPVTVKLTYGEHRVRVSQNGSSREETINVKENGPGEWIINLQTDAQQDVFFVNGVSFRMVPVKGATFTMGCTSEQGDDCYSDEAPSHRVTLSDFSIGETEVTQQLWKAVMNSEPTVDGGWFAEGGYGSNYPAYLVSWNDVQTFIRKLNQLTGKKFRLPTEAEWEFAACGGIKSRGYKFGGSNSLGTVAWYEDNADAARQVKTKSPNELGLYDMSGNVYEWCSDWYGSYSSDAQINPTGPSTGSQRVARGGSGSSAETYCRITYRGSYDPASSGDRVGFRLALSNTTGSSTNTTSTTGSIDGQSCGSVTDYDGNTYSTVKIGNQCWMKENLKTTHYSDGTSISRGYDWSYSTGYYYYPNGETYNKSRYGLLYNWKAIMRNSSSSNRVPSGVQGVCPSGWHVPSDAEWTALTTYLKGKSRYWCDGDDDNLGKALASTFGWNSTTSTCAAGNNPSANNATGFSAIPAGQCNYKDEVDNYYYFGAGALFWSSTETDDHQACSRFIGSNVPGFDRYSNDSKYMGFTVRCLRN